VFTLLVVILLVGVVAYSVDTYSSLESIGYGLPSQPFPILSVFETDRRVAGLFQDIDKLCFTKIATTINYKDGNQGNLASDFYITSPLLSLEKRFSGETLSFYDTDFRVRCDELRSKDAGRLLPIGITPKNLVLKVFVYDLGKSTPTLVRTISATQNNVQTFVNDDSPQREENIAKFRIGGNIIDNVLSESTQVYRTTVEFILEGQVEFEIPFVFQQLGKKSIVTHTIPVGLVKTVHFVNVNKVPVSDPFIGGGTNVWIESYKPKTVDISTNPNRLITVMVKLDDWKSEEGLPYIEVWKTSPKRIIGRIQAQQDSADGINTFFKATYLVSQDLPVGKYEIKATSNYVFGGLLARPLATPTVTFDVIDTSPPEPVGCEVTNSCPPPPPPPPCSTIVIDGVCQPCPNGQTMISGSCQVPPPEPAGCEATDTCPPPVPQTCEQLLEEGDFIGYLEQCSQEFWDNVQTYLWYFVGLLIFFLFIGILIRLARKKPVLHRHDEGY